MFSKICLAKGFFMYKWLLLLLVCSCKVFFKPAEQLSYLNEVEKSIRKIAVKLQPSVVYLEIVIKNRNGKENTIYANGCFIDTKGHMISVPINENSLIRINAWYKGKKYEAHLIKNFKNLGYSVTRFIAPGKTLPVTFGDTDFLSLGSFIYGVGVSGFNFGFEPIVKFGTISAIINQRADIIIHNGFSLYNHNRKSLSTLGMPIVNRDGEVIGFSAGNVIITNDDAKVVKRKFLEGDKLVDEGNSPWIGVLLDVITIDESEALKIPHKGLQIKRVYYGSPAEKAGIKFGDVLIGVNGKFFTKKNDGAFSQFRKWKDAKVNGSGEFSFWRNGKTFTKKIKYTKSPETEITKISELGFSIQKISNLDYYDYDLPVKRGVMVGKIISGGVASGSYFDQDAVNEGDVIVEFEGVKVSSVDDFRKQLNKARLKKKERILLKVLSAKFTSYVVIKPKFEIEENK